MPTPRDRSPPTRTSTWWSTVGTPQSGWGRDQLPPTTKGARNGSPEPMSVARPRTARPAVEKMPFGLRTFRVTETTNHDDLEETGEGWWLLPRTRAEFCVDAGEQIGIRRWEATLDRHRRQGRRDEDVGETGARLPTITGPSEIGRQGLEAPQQKRTRNAGDRPAIWPTMSDTDRRGESR